MDEEVIKNTERKKEKWKLSGISKRRESIVCSTDRGESRIVDRRGDKESENHQHRETCGIGDKETP